MIHFNFDRPRLTPREAQTVQAIIANSWGLQLLTMIALNGKRDPSRRELEEAAEAVRRRLSASFPDLAIEWQWTEDPESSASAEATSTDRWQADIDGMTERLKNLPLEQKIEEANADRKALAVPLATVKKIREMR